MNEEIPTRVIKSQEEEKKEEKKEVPPANQPRATYDQIAEQRLIEFIEDEINKMNECLKITSGREPSFSEVNDALTSYEGTHLALLSMYHNSKFEYNRAKEAFDTWFADKYIEVRKIMNPPGLSAQKWASTKELEMEVRVRYKEEYSKLSWDVTLTEQQLSFMRRLLDNWSRHSFILSQLSKNLIAEMSSLGLSDSFDNNPNQS